MMQGTNNVKLSKYNIKRFILFAFSELTFNNTPHTIHFHLSIWHYFKKTTILIFQYDMYKQLHIQWYMNSRWWTVYPFETCRVQILKYTHTKRYILFDSLYTFPVYTYKPGTNDRSNPRNFTGRNVHPKPESMEHTTSVTLHPTVRRVSVTHSFLIKL